MKKEKDCPFCPMFENSDATVMDIEPLNSVVKGHRIVFSKTHSKDFTDNPLVTAVVISHARNAAERIGGDFNLITSKGKHATQTVEHFHVHLIPRKENDGLHLPWTNQELK